MLGFICFCERGGCERPLGSGFDGGQDVIQGNAACPVPAQGSGHLPIQPVQLQLHDEFARLDLHRQVGVDEHDHEAVGQVGVLAEKDLVEGAAVALGALARAAGLRAALVQHLQQQQQLREQLLRLRVVQEAQDFGPNLVEEMLGDSGQAWGSPRVETRMQIPLQIPPGAGPGAVPGS